MNQITSVNNPLIIETAKLKIKKYRDRQKAFLVEGYHLVEESFRLGLLTKVFALKADDLEMFSCPRVFGKRSNHRQTFYDQIASTHYRGCCNAQNRKYWFAHSLLDRLQDPGNQR